MTPKEKAHQIYDNMYNVESHDFHNMKTEDAVQCAIIAVDEVLNVLFDYGTNEINDYWEEVKHEIENLITKTMTEEKGIAAQILLERLTNLRHTFKLLETSRDIQGITFRCISTNFTPTNLSIDESSIELKQIIIDSTKESLKNQIYKLEQELKDL